MPLPRCRGHCIPLWVAFQPLQVVLSFACSVTSLSRFPSHYLPGHPPLREDALAAHLFGLDSPSTWLAGRTTLHDTPSVTIPLGTQRGVDLPRYTWKSKLFRWCVFKCVGTMLSRQPSDAATAHRFRPHVQDAPESRKRWRASRNCKLASWNARYQRL